MLLIGTILFLAGAIATNHYVGKHVEEHSKPKQL
jgi:uncharacterized membrane protein HdeD (DUF308 family)